MSNTLARGNRIKIIHTVSRNLDEMLSAISQWMPLYMSGLIEPYFYPKKRDGLFRHTLFIAPKTGAIIASSVGNMENEANFLTRNIETVKAITEKYRQLLSLCKPLMHIFTAKDQDIFPNILEKFEKEQGDILIQSASLSLLTMPGSIAGHILSRQCGDQF